jgi:hypothetical protein
MARLWSHIIYLISRQKILDSARRSLQRIAVLMRKEFDKAEAQIFAAYLGSAKMGHCFVPRLGRVNNHATSPCSYHCAIFGSNEKGK